MARYARWGNISIEAITVTLRRESPWMYEAPSTQLIHDPKGEQSRKIGILGLGRAGAAHVQASRAHGIDIGAVAGSTYERTAQRADELGLSVAVGPAVEA